MTQFFGEKTMIDKIIHNAILTALRTGATPEKVAEVLQQEKVALLQTTEYMKAMRESEFQP
jgi:hypothetical protein